MSDDILMTSPLMVSLNFAPNLQLARDLQFTVHECKDADTFLQMYGIL